MGDQPRNAFSATANSAPSLLFLALAKVARPNWVKLRVSYSTTSSARSRIDGGMAKPSVEVQDHLEFGRGVPDLWGKPRIGPARTREGTAPGRLRLRKERQVRDVGGGDQRAAVAVTCQDEA